MNKESPIADNGFRLFMGNLGSRLTENELTTMLNRFGSIKKIHVVKDDLTGFSSGYAFVEMTTKGSAMWAASELDGKSIDGHFLIVRRLF